MHIYLRFTSCVLVPDGDPWGPKHAALIYDIIKSVVCWTVICMPILICRRTTRRIPLKQTGCRRFRVQRSCKDDTLLVGHTPWYERPTLLAESVVTALPWRYSFQSFSKLACNLKLTSTGKFKRQICLTIILRRKQLGLKCMDLSNTL
jgi:hypothetical protein